MSKLVERQKLKHYYQGEQLVRDVELVLEDLGDGHESGMTFEVRIEHPAISKTGRGQDSKQAPEVFRFQDAKSARATFDTYSKILANKPPLA